ncbi:MAG: hypothetical protein HQ472_07785 [Ignavibacteria bacterium]|nr:hypothetical protein [Ignavibacteria bacterium]
MDQTLLVFICVALGALTTLCITLALVAVRSAKELTKLAVYVEVIRTDIAEVKQSMVPVINKTGRVLDEVQGAMLRVNQGLEAVTVGTELFKSLATDVKDLEREFIERVKSPLLDVASLLASTIKGATVFIKTLTGKR